MKRKRKLLAEHVCHGHLYGNVEYNNIRFERRRSRRLKRVYYSYVITVGTAIILCLCILFCSMAGSRASFLENMALGISNIIIKNDFMSLPVFKVIESLPASGLLDFTEGLLYPNNGQLMKPETKPEDSEGDKDNSGGVSLDNIYDFDYTAVPSGHTPIIPMDLSLVTYGNTYIHNSTGLTPNTEQLLNMSFTNRLPLEYLSSTSSPTVLIIHTHGTEGYSEKGAVSYFDDGGDISRSDDVEKNVVAVGSALKEALRKKGINSLHCEIMHDKDSYRDSYARAEETIRSYLERYPTIKLVIDLHRDSVIKSSGEIVRPVTVVDGKAAAQVMCVVGSSWGGEENENWEANLALALKLRKELNGDSANLCRPVYLKPHTYNQEIAPYSLLLEVGACGNSLDEALVSAELIAEALGRLVVKI